MSALEFSFSDIYLEDQARGFFPDVDISAGHFSVESGGRVVQSLPHMTVVELAGKLSDWLSRQREGRSSDYEFSSQSTDETAWFSLLWSGDAYILCTEGKSVPEVPLLTLSDVDDAITAFRSAVISSVQERFDLDVTAEATGRP